MSDNQPKRRFFIEGDVVKHDGTLYKVRRGGSSSIPAYKFVYDRDNYPYVDCQILHQKDVVSIPFDELELIESAGVYMGAGLISPTYQDGSENEIKVASAPQLKPHPNYFRINSITWALFGAFGIDYIQFYANGAWIIEYQKTHAQSLEPRFARAFLDKIGLTEDYEPRIGRQDKWERVFNQEYPNDLDQLTPIPNYPDTPNE